MEPSLAISKNNISHEIAGVIVDYIISHSLSAGDRLPGEREFSNQLNVSRSSLREAINLLAFAGIIEKVHGKGNIVQGTTSDYSDFLGKISVPISIPNTTQFQHIQETRKACEAYIASLAARRATKSDIMVLKQSFSRLSELLSQEDVAGYQFEDVNFHKRIAYATQNPFLYEISNHYLNYLIAVKSTLARTVTIHEQHREILEAIVAGDAGRAERAVDLHIDYSIGNREYQNG